MRENSAISRNPVMYEEVLRGLRQKQKSIPSKYLYDQAGSELFEKITALDAYYLTRTERQILETHIDEICSRILPGTVLVEPGSGSSRKIQLLLDQCHRLVGYVPVDISETFLIESVAPLRKAFPELRIEPVPADYTRTFEIPEWAEKSEKRVIFYPGSTIGNFDPPGARSFLQTLSEIMKAGDGMIVGVDLVKDRDILERAYNDPQGITAAFNLNLLKRINRELDADFHLRDFEHRAHFNEDESRIEMHLVSLKQQEVTLGTRKIPFRKHESIHTENSYKYTVDRFESLAEDIFSIDDVWTDSEELFSVIYLEK